MRYLIVLGILAMTVGCFGSKEKTGDAKGRLKEDGKESPKDNGTASQKIDRKGSQNDDGKEIQKAKVRQEIFDAPFRTATELKAGQEVGMNGCRHSLP
jgi:hypothetical protein